MPVYIGTRKALLIPVKGGGGVPSEAPVITSAVTVSGSPIEGQTLTATAPSYTGSGVETWQWYDGGSPISGATSASYLLVADDVGSTPVAQFTVTNDEGSDTATSAPGSEVEDVILNAFSTGLDGFWLDAAAPSRLFQAAGAFNVTSIATAYTPGNTVGLALDQHLPVYDGPSLSLAQVLALQTNLVVNAGFASNDLTGWTNGSVGAGTVDASSGVAVLTGTAAAGGNRALVYQTQAITNGAFYYGACTVSITSGSMQLVFGTSLGSANHFGSNGATTGTKEAVFAALGAANVLSAATQSTGSVVSADDWVLKLVPGNHALQLVAGARPSYQAGPVLRSVLDDNLLSRCLPGTANTIFYLGKFNAESDVALGAKGASNGNIFLGTDAAGCIAGGVGSDGVSVIHGTNDVRGVRNCFALRHDGTTVDLWEGLTKVYTGAQSGSPTTTVPFRIMALNDNGTAASFLDGDSTVGLVVCGALADWQVNAILKKYWSRV